MRRKNVLATLMHSFVAMAIITRAVGARRLQPRVRPTGGLRRRPRVDRRLPLVALDGIAQSGNPSYAATIPHQVYMVFQMMFAIITPALITGAVRRADEVLAPTSSSSSSGRLLVYVPDRALGLGRRTAGCSRWARSISRAARSCTSPPASPRSSARSCSASGASYPQERDAAAQPDDDADRAPGCSGSAGSASTPAARSRADGSRRSPS